MKKILWLLLLVLVLVGIVGCQSNMLVDRSTQTEETPAPTVIGTATRLIFQTVTPNPTPTVVEITSFETCAVSPSSQLGGTYPRQCRTENGSVFSEALDQGITYSKTYGTQADRKGLFIVSTSDGGYLVAGISSGCWISKLDASGEQEWESDFNHELSEEFNLLYPSIWCRLARETPDGGYTAMGVAYDANFGQYRKPFMVALDHKGNLLSAQLLSNKGAKIPYLDREGKTIWLASLGITPLGIPRAVYDAMDGGYIVIGTYEQSIPDSSLHMIKTDKNGAYVWDKNLCLDTKIQQEWEKSIVCSYNAAWDAIQLKDGSFVAVGGGWLLKTDSQGNIEWMQPVSANGYSLVQLPDGGFLIAGETETDQNKNDGVLVKVDSAGNTQWLKTFGGDQDDGFRALEQRSDGEIIVMGWTKSVDTGTRLWLLQIDNTMFK